MYCTTQGMQPIFLINWKWKVTFKNFINIFFSLNKTVHPLPWKKINKRHPAKGIANNKYKMPFPSRTKGGAYILSGKPVDH